MGRDALSLAVISRLKSEGTGRNYKVELGTLALTNSQRELKSSSRHHSYPHGHPHPKIHFAIT